MKSVGNDKLKMELELAKHISLESNLMRLVRNTFKGRRFDDLTDEERELVDFAIELKWLRAGADPAVRMVRMGIPTPRPMICLDQTPDELHVENCLAKDRELHVPSFRIIWPEDMLVSGEQLISWASDDVDNDLCDGPRPQTVQDAIEILKESGTVTFGDS